jgi:hypothetical protein
MPRRVDSPRIAHHETYGRPTPIGHYLIVREPHEVDDELAGWAVEAYELGCQRR